MKKVQQIHYRYLTDADFFNLNKPAGTEERGGGQSYIDFPTSTVSVAKWEQFFSDVEHVSRTTAVQGPRWRLPIHSLGSVPAEQPVEIFRRRPASITISSQKLHTRNTNRIKAWLPSRGFPEPINPSARNGQLPDGLCVYLVRTSDNQVWAGWFIQQTQFLAADEEAARLINKMVARNNTASSSGFIEVADNENLFLSETNLYKPFSSTPSTPPPPPAAASAPAAPAAPQHSALADAPIQHPTQPATAIVQQAPPVRDEAEILKSLFSEDTGANVSAPLQLRVQAVKARNTKAVKDLKELYQNRCQISGEQFAFKKVNGEYYSEVHHLVPLGEGGADDPKNMIVVNPLIHRMLHYATITGLDLKNIKTSATGESTLEIKINGAISKITWHKDHAKEVLKHATRS